MIPFLKHDGGRAAAGYKGEAAGDCVTRAIAIATGKPYREVYDALNKLATRERTGKRKRTISNARTGVHKATTRRYMESIGWRWVPCMTIGSGCKVHLRPGELPAGRLVVALSKHSAAVIDGVLHDTYDCSRDGSRCVYGYYVDSREADRGLVGIGKAERARIHGPAYEQLERVRNLLTNAECSPLSDADDQAAALYHLTQVRAIYRRAHDEQNK